VRREEEKKLLTIRNSLNNDADVSSSNIGFFDLTKCKRLHLATSEFVKRTLGI